MVEELRSRQGTGKTMGPLVPSLLGRKATFPGEGNVLVPLAHGHLECMFTLAGGVHTRSTLGLHGGL